MCLIVRQNRDRQLTKSQKDIPTKQERFSADHKGSVLGPTLFSLYTSDLPETITTATTYLYADDTTLYCIGDSVDVVISELNKALEELLYWCKTNSLVPYLKKLSSIVAH